MKTPLVECCLCNAPANYLGTAYRRCPSLGLDVDNTEAQPILFDESVQPFVSGFAYSLRGYRRSPFSQQLDYNSLYPYFPSRMRA
jgi:hypothetical protein